MKDPQLMFKKQMKSIHYVSSLDKLERMLMKSLYLYWKNQ